MTESTAPSTSEHVPSAVPPGRSFLLTLELPDPRLEGGGVFVTPLLLTVGKQRLKG